MWKVLAGATAQPVTWQMGKLRHSKAEARVCPQSFPMKPRNSGCVYLVSCCKMLLKKTPCR